MLSAQSQDDSLFEETNLCIKIKNDKIKQASWIKIQPAFDGTYLVHHKYRDEQWGLRHIKSDGKTLGELNGLRKFQYKMISQDQVILIQKKQNKVKITTWNLRTNVMTDYLHIQKFNQQYSHFYIFPETKMICIQGNLQIKGQEDQINNLKVFTYYQHPLERSSDPINSYSFKLQHKEHHYIFQVNNSNRLVLFNFLLDQNRNAKSSQYRVCDQNGFRMIKCPRISINESIYYFPRQIIQDQLGSLFVRFSFQHKNLQFKNLDITHLKNTPTCPEGVFNWPGCYQDNYLYQTFWTYNKYNEFKTVYKFNKGRNSFFVNRIPNDTDLYINRNQKIARIDFIGHLYWYCRYGLIETIQERKLYQRFYFSNYDPNVCFFYQFKQNQETIQFDLRVIKIKKFQLEKCLNYRIAGHICM